MSNQIVMPTLPIRKYTTGEIANLCMMFTLADVEKHIERVKADNPSNLPSTLEFVHNDANKPTGDANTYTCTTTGGSRAGKDSELLKQVRADGKSYKKNPSNYDFLANTGEPIIVDGSGKYRHIQYAYKEYKIKDSNGEMVAWKPSDDFKKSCDYFTNKKQDK